MQNRTVHKFRDSVTVEVQLTPTTATTLANWASVSRTLNEAIRLLDHIADNAGMSDDMAACIDELEDLEPALNELHMSVRGRLWLAPHDEAQSDVTERDGK